MVKKLIRDGAATLLAATGLTSPRARAADHLSIATFHRVLPETRRRSYPLPGLCVTPTELDFFLRYFTERYTVGSLRDTWWRWRSGARPSKPLLALTFDDAQLDNFEHARPVLERFGVRASFYVPVTHVDEQQPIWHDRLGFALLRALDKGKADAASVMLDGPLRPDTVGARIEGTKDLDPVGRAQLVERLEALAGRHVPSWAGLMSWDQLRTLHAEGHEVASHSMTHAILTQIDDAQLTHELVTSKARLEEELDAPVVTFCYPNGNADEHVARRTAEAGYECAVTTRWGSNAPGASSHLLHRCDMHADHARDRGGNLSAERVALRMSGLQPGL